MASENENLPIIDFTKPDLKPGTPEWNSVKVQIRQALEKLGMFEALFDKISKDLRDIIFDPVVELFNLPLETKLKLTDLKNSVSYLGSNYPELGQLYESMGIEEATIAEKVESLTNQLWPQGNPNFSNVVTSYSQQMSELDKIVRTMIFESFGLEKYNDEQLQMTKYVVFLNKYKPPESNKAEIALKSHKDQNLLTILEQTEVDGFQLQTKDGQWIDVKLSPGSFMIVLGEYLSAWLNGRLHAPTHRVVMSGDQVRYSIGLFASAKTGFKVEAPEELIDEEHPRVFKPFYHNEYVEYLHVNVARDDLDLTTYSSFDKIMG